MLLRAYESFTAALEMAEGLDDARARTAALGSLGALYQLQGRLAEAHDLTARALRSAEKMGGREVQMRLYAQAGRIDRARGDRESAIRHLEEATLLAAEGRKSSRSTPRARPRADDAAAVRLELVDLLLRRAAEQPEPALGQADLRRAQQTIERTKANELRDYFRDECVDAYREKTVASSSVSPSAAIVYPLSLPDRMVLLVSHAGLIRQFVSEVPSAALDAEVEDFGRLVRKRLSREFLRPARRLYDWLVEPFVEHPALGEVDTLVFVPGGSLRTVPMAALHDGEHFLIERFAVATIPGLELVDPAPLDRAEARFFLGGLSKAVGDYPPLDHVSKELGEIERIFGGKKLFDSEFTTQRLRSTLREHEFSVVHIATHGEFRTEGESSFLVTYDGQLTMDELADAVGAFRFRDRPLELIVLSACETAVGDQRAALGLAGIAVKAGARSAIGTLWTVNDATSAQLMASFYRELQTPGVSRAKALQRAQLELMADGRFAHPQFWSPFLLINSWL
jgi:CHAT domain-containing protein